jgi:nucleotide-binding universal stress UspA family protein
MSTAAQTPAGAVVVGIDGSPESWLALQWAAQAAARRDAPLHLLYAVDLTGYEEAVPQVLDTLMHEAETTLAQALSRAQEVTHVPAGAETVVGPAVPALLAAAELATMVVVGSHGHGRVADVLLGSVSQHISRHAPCPVVVVRPPADPDANRIVVGIDGSPNSQAAVELALEEASRSSAPVLALYAAPEPGPTAGGLVLMRTGEDAERRRAVAERVLAEALDAWEAKYPDVHVTREVVADRPSHALAAASEHAGLVVVGARGRGGFAGLLLGSVTQSVLHVARCPVAVVRPRPER